MAFLKCKMCGGDIELSADRTIGTCDHCGSIMTFPKVDNEQRAQRFNRGNQLRRSGEFDKALAAYEQIVQEDNTDAEAHWCCALCRFGIEYVEDPNTLEYLPTCHRASFESFLKDVDYLAAVEYSDGVTRRQYQKEAYKIAEVQKGILATSQNEEPFDVFICYKESEDDGTRTRDSLLAQEIYYQLTEAGRRVFFSRITLEDKAGTEYEPYIFAALNSARVMVLVTTSAEHANAVWVKNEWSRFLSLMRKDRHKLLLPCYRDMDPYDLPEALSVLQSYDMSRIGFIQDLIRGVNKVLEGSKKAEKPKETIIVQQTMNSNSAPLLRRAFMFLEDEDWERADEFCEQVLNQEPENAEAYLGKLMAELHVKSREVLKDQAQLFDKKNNYQKAMRFGDKKLKELLSEATEQIKERNRIEQLTNTYKSAVNTMQNAKSRSDFSLAAQLFRSIKDFKDSENLEQQCCERIEQLKKEEIYVKALHEKGQKRYREAVLLLDSILDYKDAEEQKGRCVAAEEVERKEKVYQEAIAAMNQGAYEKAEKSFNAIFGYKDAREKKAFCAVRAEEERKSTIYAQAIQAARIKTIEGQQKAIELFESIYGWRDTNERIDTAKRKLSEFHAREKRENKKSRTLRAIFLIGFSAALITALIVVFFMVIRPNLNYKKAVNFYKTGQYEKAITTFGALNGFKDSEEYFENCKTVLEKENRYVKAMELYNAEKYAEAITELTALNGYKDSKEKIEEIRPLYYKELLIKATVGSTVFFGSYEQDNDTLNGKEDIEWTVLEKKDSRILAISKYALDCQQFNSTKKNITWETCSLRNWLNETFVNTAFSSKEKSCLVGSTVTADNNPLYNTSPGKRTWDKVFLLSIDEAERYFNSDIARQCIPTQYAIANNTYVFNDGTCWWWLRSPGCIAEYAGFVNNEGAINCIGFNIDDDGITVRPALWIETSILMDSISHTGNDDANAEKNNVPDNLMEKTQDIRAGETIYFGVYEQDNNLNNGKEDIEWIVLEKKGKKALIISKYALDCQPYHTSNKDVTWENCSLRKWLNKTFLDTAFTSDEQGNIINSVVTAYLNPSYNTPSGNNTMDKVFLLSIPEIDKYFRLDNKCQCQGTEYCYAKGVSKGSNNNCWWWLRTPGKDSNYAATIYDVGSVNKRGNTVSHNRGAVRPVLWIDLDYFKDN